LTDVPVSAYLLCRRFPRGAAFDNLEPVIFFFFKKKKEKSGRRVVYLNRSLTSHVNIQRNLPPSYIIFTDQAIVVSDLFYPFLRRNFDRSTSPARGTAGSSPLRTATKFLDFSLS